MKLVISHFFNEEYLLPWWLMHHREIFDHGILIDYNSTDQSVDLCREIVPDWEIITTENEFFSAVNVDFEVMKHEARYPAAWKIALNTTEFLVGSSMEILIENLEQDDQLGAMIPGAVLVDNKPEMEPDPSSSLVDQKFHGFMESEFPSHLVKYDWFFTPNRTRLLHRHSIGAYTTGRHSSMLPKLVDVSSKDLAIWWFGFSPWTPQFMQRKSQIQTKMPQLDKSVGWGVQHLANESTLQSRRLDLMDFSYDLSTAESTELSTLDSKRKCIDVRNEAVAERNTANAERDNAFAEREAANAERDNAVAEREAANAERDNAIAEREVSHAERDNAIAEREAANAERDNAISEREAANAERDTAIAERDTANTERDNAIAEREAANIERDNVSAENEKLLAIQQQIQKQPWKYFWQNLKNRT